MVWYRPAHYFLGLPFHLPRLPLFRLNMTRYLFALLFSLGLTSSALAVTYIYPDGNRYSSPQAYCDILAAPWIPAIVTTTAPVAGSPLVSGSCYNSGNTMVGGWYYRLDSASATCTSGKPVSSGQYDLGTDPNAPVNGAPPLSTCDGGCSSRYVGDSIGARQLVGGVYHYYAKGAYEQTGQSCSGGSAAPSSSPTLPDATCGAGQALGQVNGQNRCVNTDGTASSPNSAAAASSVAAANTQTATSSSTTNTTTTNSGNTTNSTSYSTTSTTTVNNNGAGAGAGAGGGVPTSPSDPMTTFCTNQPDSPLCVNSFTGSPASTSTVSNWYVKKYPNGIQSVIQNGMTAMQNTPLGGMIQGFQISISGGTNGCFAIPSGNLLGVPVGGDFCIPPTVLNFIGWCMIIGALFLSRALIFGG